MSDIVGRDIRDPFNVRVYIAAMERKQRRIAAAEKAAADAAAAAAAAAATQATAKKRSRGKSSGNPGTSEGRQQRAEMPPNFYQVPDNVRVVDQQRVQLRRANSAGQPRPRPIRPLEASLQMTKTPDANADCSATRTVSTPHIHPEAVDAANAASGSPPMRQGKTALTQPQQRSLSTTYINAVRSDASASSVGCARITKSVSQHGSLANERAGPTDAYDLGMHSGRRFLSQAELEYIRRSQVFRMIKSKCSPMYQRIVFGSIQHVAFLSRKQAQYILAVHSY